MLRLRIATILLLSQASWAVAQDSLRAMDCVERLLSNDPQIRIQRTRVVQQNGAVLQAKAPYDLSTQTTIQASRDYTPLVSPLGIVFPTVTTNQYSIGLSQLLSLGATLSLSTGVQSQDVASNIVSDTRLQNRGFMMLNVDVPLLRNRGNQAQQRSLDGAKLELQAVRSDVLQSLNVRVADVLTAYLDLWFNHRMLLMAQEMEQHAERTYRNMQEYTAADKRAASDVRQAESNYLSRVRDRIGARQSYMSSYAQLLVVMGDSLPQTFVPPVPAAIPAQFQKATAATINIDTLLRVALEQRPDIRGLTLRRQVARTLLLSAQQRQEPQLDLGFTLGTNGFNNETSASRFVTAIGSNSTPFNASARLSWSLPIQNSQAMGEMELQQAAYERSNLQEQDIIRSIRINCRLAVERLRAAQDQLDVSARHVAISRAVLDDEELKMQNGTSTLVDFVVLQDNLVNARIGLYQARREVAAAIIQMRFLASMFFYPNGETLTFDDQTLYDLSDLMR